MAKARIAQLTSVHHLFDNRIFEKECGTLAASGYEVFLVGRHPRDETIDGVNILGVPEPKNRFMRVLVTAFQVFRRARALDADIYHFHDPELIPWGIVLRIMGKPVVYDVHEDFVTGLALVPYWPRVMGEVMGRLYGLLEAASKSFFHIVVAERYYARRLKNSTFVLNYPKTERFDAIAGLNREPPAQGHTRLIYTGVLGFNRGAVTYAELARELDNAETLVIGRIHAEVGGAMRATCPDETRLKLVGVGQQVPYDTIIKAYKEPWTAALALFHDTPFSREKEITKFFEYMAAGIPIVASDFPVWKELIEGNGVGICVNPDSLEEIKKAVIWLRDNPDEARAMGERGRQAVAEKYNWQSQAQNLFELYDSILAGRSTADVWSTSC
jgi:glycosyltransferase involved in cell wall biosynthesis